MCALWSSHSAFPVGHQSPRCVRFVFKQNNWHYGLLHLGVALCSRHIPATNRLTKSRNGNGLGRLRQPLMWFVGLVDVVLIRSDIGRRWCPVPLIVALSILRPARRVDNLGQLAKMGVKHAVTCTLVLASFRRLLRQERVPSCTRNVPIRKMSSGGSLHEMVATDSHIELGVEFPTRTWALGCCSLSAQNVAVEKVLPLDYSTMLLPPVVGVCLVPVSPNEQVAVLPLQSPILSALRELERTGTNMESNVQLRLTRCSCGEYHMCLTACR